jgi:hypothetical protein
MKPKSRLGMIHNGYNRQESKGLTESKDFETFYQRSILPKELQKLNPALLGINPRSVTPMRSLSPVCREVSEEEKDLIRIKYKLK